MNTADFRSSMTSIFEQLIPEKEYNPKATVDKKNPVSILPTFSNVVSVTDFYKGNTYDVPMQLTNYPSNLSFQSATGHGNRFEYVLTKLGIRNKIPDSAAAPWDLNYYLGGSMIPVQAKLNSGASVALGSLRERIKRENYSIQEKNQRDGFYFIKGNWDDKEGYRLVRGMDVYYIRNQKWQEKFIDEFAEGRVKEIITKYLTTQTSNLTINDLVKLLVKDSNSPASLTTGSIGKSADIEYDAKIMNKKDVKLEEILSMKGLNIKVNMSRKDLESIASSCQRIDFTEQGQTRIGLGRELNEYIFNDKLPKRFFANDNYIHALGRFTRDKENNKPSPKSTHENVYHIVYNRQLFNTIFDDKQLTKTWDLGYFKGV